MWNNCLSVNDLIKVCAQLRIPPKSLFTSGYKLETSCEQPRHLTKNSASVHNGTAHLKNVNNCLNTNTYSYLETSGSQSSDLYLNVVPFFNTSVK